MKLLHKLLLWMVCALCAMPAMAARDWTRTVAATPEGGYLIGNPKAPVKVIEYFSLTCSHCRHFAETGMVPLKAGYVAKGKVSLELRNFVLNAPDFSASLLMRCGSPAQAVKLFDQAFAAQEELFKGAYTLSQDAIGRINAVPMEQRPSALAREAGIDKWFIAKGISAKQAAACLADTKRSDALVDLRKVAATKLNVQGTPAFLVNGTLVDGTGWENLEPAIVKALGG